MSSSLPGLHLIDIVSKRNRAGWWWLTLLIPAPGTRRSEAILLSGERNIRQEETGAHYKQSEAAVSAAIRLRMQSVLGRSLRTGSPLWSEH